MERRSPVPVLPALALAALALVAAGCTRPGGGSAAVPVATAAPQALPDGSACASSAQCAGGNCRFGVCCARGGTCCSAEAPCPSGLACGPGHACEAANSAPPSPTPGPGSPSPPPAPSPAPVSGLSVQDGDAVLVDYVGWTPDDRVVFDASEEGEAREAGLPPRGRYEPLRVVVGDGQVIRGFERGLVGMSENETRELLIPPEDGYGPRRPQLVKPMPVETLRKQGVEPEEGGYLVTTGGAFPILNVTGDSAWVDFNPMLAGRELAFRVTVRSIERPGGPSPAGGG